jgi:2'-5' RNA ligase superfamily
VVAALECYFDVTATRRIRTVWDALEEAGVPSLRQLSDRRHRPHLSLAVADSLDPVAVAEALDGMTVAPPLTIELQYVGTFVGRVLWLGPAPTAELLAHHAAVCDRLAVGGVEVSELYRPGVWVPHCTLSMRVPLRLMTDALRLCLDVLPIAATLTNAAVADHARGIHHPLPGG